MKTQKHDREDQRFGTASKKGTTNSVIPHSEKKDGGGWQNKERHGDNRNNCSFSVLALEHK